MQKSIWVVIVLSVLLTFPFVSQAASAAEAGWRVEYYDNSTLSGQPRLSFVEATFGHDWGYGSPSLEIPADHFSARWTSTRHFEQGSYLFFLTVDDGARVWLDGQLIIDAWDIGRQEDVQARLRISQTGNHEIQVAYFEKTGKAEIQLDWLQLGGEDDIVGAWQGEYFNNRELAGAPVITRQDSGIRFNWNLGPPHPKVPRDNFSIRWTRSIYLSQPAFYNFRIQHDDGMRVYVDGKIIYDSWFDQAVTYKTRRIPLKAGYRTFVIEYYDHIGNAVAQLTFDEDPGDYGDDQTGPGPVVDNDGPRFLWEGPRARRLVAGGGYGSNFFWTPNTSQAPINSGKWVAPISAAGNYELFAFIPGDRSTTTSARYRIQHFGKIATRVIDQSRYSDEFVSLGIYYFGADGHEFVLLPDSTGEAPGTTSIAFDAIKFVRR